MDKELELFLSRLSPETKAEMLKTLEKIAEREHTSAKKRGCKYQYHTVSMQYHYHCKLCGSSYTETHPFDILIEEEPKEFYEKKVLLQVCLKCEEALMQLEKEHLIKQVVEYIRCLTMLK